MLAELVGVDGDSLPLLADAFELNGAINKGIDGIVATFGGVDARMDTGASLSIDDVASKDLLTVTDLSAKSSASGITAVLGARNAFLGGE